MKDTPAIDVDDDDACLSRLDSLSLSFLPPVKESIVLLYMWTRRDLLFSYDKKEKELINACFPSIVLSFQP